ncbi:MAG: TMEM165/GDT1 family protein [Rhizonema sp. NSF051]|nr:TMEM165/GDT1 family protein [Rhizonema sp. NSF051]
MKLDTAHPSYSESQLESQPEIEECHKCYSDTWVCVDEQPEAEESSLSSSESSEVSERNFKQQSIAVTFSTTFFTIFLAEIGDKTQLSTLLMSAQSHSPWIVFLGSGVALVTTSLLGVALGSWIAKCLSPKTVERGAGIMMLVISLLLFWDVLQL